MIKIISICLMLLFSSLSYANVGDDFYKAGKIAFRAGDFNEAFILYHKAAEKGHFYATRNLYALYSSGKSKNINGKWVKVLMPQPDKHASILKMMKQSNDPKMSMYLGVLYKNGKGVVRSPKKAFYYYEKAADQQYKPAIYFLGLFYKNGYAVQQDIEYGNELMCRVNSTYKFCKDNSKYVGAIRNGIADGKGVRTYASGTTYTGIFKYGKLVKGVKAFSNGTRYEGEFVKGKFYGKGVKQYFNGSRYEGEFKNSKFDGKGIRTLSRGTILKGVFEKGHIVLGSELRPNGNRYQGHFKNGRYDGIGLKTTAKGYRYQGHFKNGRREGKGEYISANGSRYQGHFKNGWRDGKGVYIYANGDRYEGDYKKSKMDGKGVLTYASGEQLKGTFKAGKFLGYKKIAKVSPSSARPSSKNISNEVQKHKEAYIRKLLNNNRDIKDAFSQVSYSSQMCKHYRRVKSDVMDIDCDSSENCNELQDDLTRQLKRDGRDACSAAQRGRQDLVGSFGKDNERAITNVLYAFTNEHYVRNSVKDEYSGAIRSLKNAVREEERLASEVKDEPVYEVSGWAAGLSKGLSSISNSMPDTSEILRQNQKIINESYRKTKLKIKKTRSRRSVKRYERPSYNKISLNLYKKKLSSIDLEQKCKAKGGSFDARRNNCTIRKTIQTAVLHNGGVNSIYGNKPVPGTLNYRAKSTRTTNNKSSGNSSSINNKNLKKRSQGTIHKIAEAKALCWTWKSKRGNKRWLCAGPIQKLLASEATEKKALKYVGCGSYRKKFSNVRFSVRSGKQYKYDRAFIYGCGKPVNNTDYMIDKSFYIKYPANVILTKFTCSTDVFLGNYRKYCK